MEFLVGYEEGMYSASLINQQFGIHGEGSSFDATIQNLIDGIRSYNAYQSHNQYINIDDVTLSFRLSDMRHAYHA